MYNGTKSLEQAEADKFNILDEVKNIDVPDIAQPTLSIGFSDDGDSNVEKSRFSKSSYRYSSWKRWRPGDC